MQHLISDCYEIFYDDRRVVGYSTGRLPFEPKDWQVGLKRDLRSAIEQLRAAEGEGVAATYGTDNGEDFFDSENALFYNVGTGAFREIAKHHIAFDTLSARETELLLSQTNKTKYHHYYLYQIGPFRQCQSAPLIKWNDIELSALRGDNKPFDFWKLFREKIGEIELSSNRDYMGQFGIALQLYEPETKEINLVNLMKPLLDGIICSFHRMPDEIDMDMLLTVGSRLNLPAESFLYKDKTILGEEIYIRPYRENVSWNPQDDRCFSSNISITYGAKKRCFSGLIYPMP